MPRIIKALIKARNWFLVCETNTFVTEQVYLNPKNKSSFLLINYKKQLNESFNECANFSKKIRITTETHAKSKEQNTARVGRSKTKMSVIVSNEKLNSFYIRGLYALSTLFSKENVELLQKEIGLQHPDFDFSYWEYLNTLHEIEEEHEKTKGSNSKAILEAFAKLRFEFSEFVSQKLEIFRKKYDHNNSVKRILKSLAQLSLKLDDKRSIVRIFNGMKDQIYKREAEIIKQIEVCVRVYECSNKFTIQNFNETFLLNNFSYCKKENSVTFKCIKYMLKALLTAESTSVDIKIKNMLTEGSDHSKE